MPRYVAYRDLRAIGPAQVEFEGSFDKFRARFPDSFCLEFSMPPGTRPLHLFDAPDGEHARVYYERLKVTGCSPDLKNIGDAGSDSVKGAKMWRYRGDGKHLTEFCGRFGLPDHVVRDIQADRRFQKITNQLNELTKLYFGCRKENGVAILGDWQRPGVLQMLAIAEREALAMGLLAAAALDAIDPAYRAFGVPHQRCFAVTTIEPAPVEATAPLAPAAAVEPTEPTDHESTQNKRPRTAVAAGAK